MRVTLKISSSSLNCFQSCPRKWRLRYQDELEPIAWEEPPALSLGRAWHRLIEEWMRSACMDVAILSRDEIKSDIMLRLQAMAERYIERWGALTPWKVMAIECPFDGLPVINPASGHPSTVLQASGRLDGLIEQAGRVLVYEAKTVGRIDSAYLEALFHSPQTGLYAIAAEAVFGVRVEAVLYDLVQKPSGNLKQRTGETEQEFEERRAALAAKNKSGKSSAKRKLSESDEAFLLRLKASLTDDCFQRIEIPVTPESRRFAQEHLWQRGQSLLVARRFNLFPQNRGACYHWGRECEFLPLCNAGETSAVRETLYCQRRRREEGGVATTPVF